MEINIWFQYLIGLSAYIWTEMIFKDVNVLLMWLVSSECNDMLSQLFLIKFLKAQLTAKFICEV